MLKSKPWFRQHDGWWYCTLRIDGKQQQRKLVRGEDKEAEATTAYHQLMVQHGEHIAEPATTVPILCAEFLEAHLGEFAPETYDWYLYYLESFCNFYRDDVAELRPAIVKHWADRQKWGDPSRRAGYTCVKRLMNWAVDQGKLHHSPLVGLKRPPAKRREKIVATAEHTAMVEKSDEHFAVFLKALRETGARPGELRNLTVDMVDLKAGRWVLPKHKTVKKTGKPRIIYLSPAMVRLTRKLLAKHPDGYLFRNRFGRQWSSNAVRCRMRRLREKLGLAAGTVAYSYRHAYATDALAKGIAPQFVAELLGHQDLDMVSRVYSHVDQKTELLRKVAKLATAGAAR